MYDGGHRGSAQNNYMAEKIGVSAAIMAVIAITVLIFGCAQVTDYEAAVGKTRFTGNVHDQSYGQGLHQTITKSLTRYRLREQQYPAEGESEALTALTADNMEIRMDAAFRWFIDPAEVSDIYLTIGDMNAVHAFVYNAYRNAVRDAVSELNAADVMSSERQRLPARVQELMSEKLEPRGISVSYFFVREILPPDRVKQAVEQKVAREQQVAAEKFQTQVVMEQANQRREEALGIRDAQNIIAQSLEGEAGRRYLHWRYLEMLGVIGAGENNMVIAPTEGGLPLFFAPN